MKITIQPTTKSPHNTVEITTPNDDLPIEEAVELVKNALMAWGYHPESVDEYFSEE